MAALGPSKLLRLSNKPQRYAALHDDPLHAEALRELAALGQIGDLTVANKPGVKSVGAGASAGRQRLPTLGIQL
jgi:hypothetical protein